MPKWLIANNKCQSMKKQMRHFTFPVMGFLIGQNQLKLVHNGLLC